MNRIPRVLLAGLPLQKGELQLPAEAGHHLCRVLRMQAGDRLDLMDGAGQLAEAVLLTSTKMPMIRVEHLFFQEPCEPQLCACLPMIRPERTSSAAEKLCELGVNTIQLYHSAFTGNRRKQPDLRRLERIAIAACEQSGNLWLPKILAPVELDVLLKEQGKILLGDAHEKNMGKTPISALTGETGTTVSASALALLVGPEGGFHPNEIDAIDAKNVTRIALGPWVLRADTALPALAAVVNAALGRHRTKQRIER